MKYIITESQNERLIILRRLPELIELIRNQYPYIYPCDYHSLGQYLLALKIEMFEVMWLDWYEKMDREIVWNVIKDTYGEKIVENYMNRCKE